MTDRDPTDAPLRWLFLDLNSYFASVEQQHNPNLRGKPVVVSPAETEYTCAIAASQEAKKHGIKTGTIIADARVKCPGLIVVQARHDLYVKTHHQIVAEVWNHIPVSAVCSIDEVACKLIGRERIPENAAAIANRIKHGIRRNVGEYLSCSVGLAPSRMLAKVAADMQKPDGLTVLESHDLPTKISELKLGDFPGIGWNMVRRLREHGVETVPDLWALSAKRTKAIWNSIEGERFWHELHGHDVPDRPPPRKSSVGHSHVLAKVMRDAPATRLVARRLLLKACTRLRRMGLAAGALVLHATLESLQKVDMWKKPRWGDDQNWSADAQFHPTQDSIYLLARLDEMWADAIRTHPNRRFKAVGVVLHSFCPLDRVMGDLFMDPALDPRTPQRGVQLYSAVDRINKKYGQDTVALGVLPGQIAKYVGAKIAFTRIPELAEFDE
jgi:DNA polymerase IV